MPGNLNITNQTGKIADMPAMPTPTPATTSAPSPGDEHSGGVGTDDSRFTTLSVDAIKRIGRDVRDMLKEPHENIHYIHSTTSVGTGYAMVVGTEGTPYFGVPMFYRIDFPDNYPHSPPRMKFLTYSSPNGTSVRMHPNYYVNGKCCLSILNSWTGEKWTGCQTLRSLLMTVLMTLTDNPLSNEPGYSRECSTHDDYRAVVTEAGLFWISQFVSQQKNGSVRFCDDDDENAKITTQFHAHFIENFARSDQYGKKILSLLNEYDDTQSGMYYNWLKDRDNHTFNICCYRAYYTVRFANTKDKTKLALEQLLQQPDH